MKKFLFLSVFFLFLFTKSTNAQVVDKSISGVQTGLLGIWWNNEVKLVKNWTLRSEVGYAAPIYSRAQYKIEANNKYGYFYPVFQPVVSFEPRWYYNSRKRQGNSKNTFHNSGNYITLAIQYFPKFLTYSPLGNSDEFLAFDAKEPNGGLFFTPTWGIRRNISYRWNYEIAAGLGIDLFERSPTTKEAAHYGNDFILNIHLRIGYKYGMKTIQKTP